MAQMMAEKSAGWKPVSLVDSRDPRLAESWVDLLERWLVEQMATMTAATTVVKLEWRWVRWWVDLMVV